jgi:hypothetical protein
MPAAGKRRPAALLAALLAAGCASHTVALPVAAIPTAERSLSVFLIGDAGKPEPAGDIVLQALAIEAAAAPRGSAIVFLGDNIYPHGLPAPEDPERAEMERRLDAQIEVARRSGLRTVFAPGNHDWDRMGADGWNSVRRAEGFIRERGQGLASQLPADGCPGPEVVDLGATVRLILLDTQWWLHPPDLPKPRDPGSSCSSDSESEVAQRLAAVLAESTGRPVIVAGHHPLATAGEHGGRFPVTTHLFPFRALKKWLWIPLPGLGSIYPIARANGITSQDLSGAANERMRAALGRAMAAHPPLLFAAGHEHTLQLFRGPFARFSAVSGAGMNNHEGAVGWRDSTLYASSGPGYMRVDISSGGRVRLAVIEVRETGTREAAAFWLQEP